MISISFLIERGHGEIYFQLCKSVFIHVSLLAVLFYGPRRQSQQSSRHQVLSCLAQKRRRWNKTFDKPVLTTGNPRFLFVLTLSLYSYQHANPLKSCSVWTPSVFGFIHRGCYSCSASTSSRCRPGLMIRPRRYQPVLRMRSPVLNSHSGSDQGGKRYEHLESLPQAFPAHRQMNKMNPMQKKYSLTYMDWTYAFATACTNVWTPYSYSSNCISNKATCTRDEAKDESSLVTRSISLVP